VQECAGLLALFASLSTLVGATYFCVSQREVMPLIPAVMFVIFWVFFAGVVLHPESVNARVTQATGAGDEAVELITFFLRTLLKLVPLYALGLAAIGVLIIVLGFFDLAEPLAWMTRRAFVPVPNILSEGYFPLRGAGMLTTACLVPVLGYVSFVLLSLPLEMWRVLLGLPTKLDNLKR
jgi:hypothetical protein